MTFEAGEAKTALSVPIGRWEEVICLEGWLSVHGEVRHAHISRSGPEGGERAATVDCRAGWGCVRAVFRR